MFYRKASIRALYQILLAREPRGEEITNARRLMAAGQSIQDIALQLLKTPEFKAGAETNPLVSAISTASAIQAIYRVVLNRIPDDATTARHQREVGAGLSLEGLAATLFGSAEFSARAFDIPLVASAAAVDHRRVIQAVYRLLLDRDPEDFALAHYQTQFSNGLSLGDLANVLANSEEFKYRALEIPLVAAAAAVDHRGVTRALYQALLDRSPDAAEIGQLQSRLNQGHSLSNIIAGLIDSHEFRTRCAGLSVVRAATDPDEMLRRIERIEAPVAATSPRTSRPTIFIDCTDTLNSELHTGIQRVVRNVLRHAAPAAVRHGYDVVPVVLDSGGFIGANRRIRVGEEPSVVAEEPRNPDWSVRLDAIASHDGNILLLLDSSWTADIWPSVSRFRKAGGFVASVVYDLIPVSHPESCSDVIVTAFASWLRYFALLTDAAFAISRATKHELETHLSRLPTANAGIPVTHFPLGCDIDVRSGDVPLHCGLGEIFGGPAATFIVVGTIEPRKNHPFILDAFEQLWGANEDVALAIIGKRDWKSDAFLDRAKAHALYGRRLHLLRDISDAELDYAYRNAAGLIIASQAEGFGLPIVEAFQRSLPVLCSDIPVFRETAGDDAVFFSLDTPTCLAQAIRDFLKSRAQGRAARRSDRTLTTWEASAAELLGGVVSAYRRARQQPMASGDVAAPGTPPG